MILLKQTEMMVVFQLTTEPWQYQNQNISDEKKRLIINRSPHRPKKKIQKKDPDS